MEEDSTTVEQFDPSDYDLPADWNWLSDERDDCSGYTEIHFGYNEETAGGWLGQICGGESRGDYQIQVRTILSRADNDGSLDTVPQSSADEYENFDSLEEALDAVVGFIESNYPETIEA